MRKSRKRKNRRLLKVLLGLLGVVVLAAAAVTVWQWDNLGALMFSRQHSATELEGLLAAHEKNTETILAQLPYVSLRPLTEEEKAQLSRGELTEDEAAERILGRPAPGADLTGTNPDVPAANTDPGTPANASAPGADTEPSRAPDAAPPSPPPAPADEKQAQISTLIARVYVLRESMTGQLEGIVGRAKAEYGALPKSQRTDVKKGEFATRCLREAAALERQCDATVDTILKELDTLLRETGGDASLVPSIRRAYAEEKSLKKSYFIKTYS
ncbi:MAG: hypothetical protein LBH86_09680 [Oscillospiraceae bacterium]|jgi:hypothetical protein|nr:hypothetical protein [Oscillospiraceae bacterium]